jgi:pimeloyl-ACP methyl ester carboxylesterase
MGVRILLATVFCGALSACASLLGPTIQGQAPELADPRLHLMYIDEDGDLMDPVTKLKVRHTQEASSEALDTMGTGTAPGIAALGSGLKQQERWNARRIDQAKELTYVRKMIQQYLNSRQASGAPLTPVVHIHGGLNNYDTVLDRAQTLPPYMLSDGHYPFFIGWPSDFWFSLKEHVKKSDRGRERSLAGSLYFGALQTLEDLVRSMVRIPSSIVRQIDNMSLVPLSAYKSEERDAEGRASLLSRAGFDVISEEPFTGVGGSYVTIINPVGWLATPLRDGFGQGAWNSMLRQTELVLTKASVYEGEAIPSNPKWRSQVTQARGAGAAGPSDTAVRLFLREWQSAPETRGQPITLVAHSMGAIIALNVLSRHPEVKFDNVVFMGAAARMKHVESVLIPWLVDHPEARFYNLSLDPYNEIAERTYYDFAPRGSLLMWIEDSFGEVNAFRDRTIGKWWNVVRIAEDLFPVESAGQGIRDRVTLKRFAIDANGSLGPQSHGSFNLYCWWRKSFWGSDQAAKPLLLESRSTRIERPTDTCLTSEAAPNTRDNPSYRPKEAKPL